MDDHAPAVENASDEEQVRRAGQRDKHRAKQQRHQLLTVLKTDVGRTVLFRILEHCGVFVTPFAGDPNVTAFNCGKQNIGQWLMAEIERADGTMLFRMMQEHAAAEAADAAAHAASRTKSAIESA